MTKKRTKFGVKWEPKLAKKCYFCESFQDFWKKIRQLINIKGFPYLSGRIVMIYVKKCNF